MMMMMIMVIIIVIIIIIIIILYYFRCEIAELVMKKIRVSLFDDLFQISSNLKLKQRKRNEKRKGPVTVFVKVFLVSANK